MSCTQLHVHANMISTKLPDDLLCKIFAMLDPYPSIFVCSRVCIHWCSVARFAIRRVVVPATCDALLRAVHDALPGDTLFLDPGVHELSSVLTINKPLRILSNVARHGKSALSANPRHYDYNDRPILVSTRNVLICICANAVLADIVMVRMRHTLGYPNAVVAIQNGRAHVKGCSITCGGGFALASALEAFSFLSSPRWDVERPEVFHTNMPTEPQSGVWVGIGAHAIVESCAISCCMGPGIKVYRGKLNASFNTIAFSRCGGNVVANGGVITLYKNSIHGSGSNGVVTWSNANISIIENDIWSNTGYGIEIKRGAVLVAITDNRIYDNGGIPLCFDCVTSNCVNIGRNYDRECLICPHSLDGNTRLLFTRRMDTNVDGASFAVNFDF